MLRNKLSFLLASSLCLSFAACDDGDDGDDTGAGATESGTTDAPTTDTPTTDTPTTDTPTTGTPTTDTPTTDDSSTTDDTSDDSSTTDDTSTDACEGVKCEANQTCLGGICVDDVGETEGGGDPDPNYPDPADGCAAPNLDANTAGLNVCAPPCGDNDACPATTVGGMGVCGLGTTQTMEGPVCKNDEACDTEAGFTCQALGDGSMRCFQQTHCIPACTAAAECPDGMMCDMTTGICLY